MRYTTDEISTILRAGRLDLLEVLVNLRMTRITPEEIKHCVNHLVTTDYKGREDKLECLQKLLTPLAEAMIYCEAHVWADKPESEFVGYLLRTFEAAGFPLPETDHGD